MTKTIPKKKKFKKEKWLSEEALQIAEDRSERQRKKDKIYPTEGKVPERNGKNAHGPHSHYISFSLPDCAMDS